MKIEKKDAKISQINWVQDFNTKFCVGINAHAFIIVYMYVYIYIYVTNVLYLHKYITKSKVSKDRDL